MIYEITDDKISNITKYSGNSIFILILLTMEYRQLTQIGTTSITSDNVSMIFAEK